MFKVLFMMSLVAVISSCTKEIPADPACRTQKQSVSLPPANAVCLIKLNGKLVSIKNKNAEFWQLPYAKQQMHTSAQCTAHRSAWKTTGLNVSVGKLLFVDKLTTHYFACLASSQFSNQQHDLPVPNWLSHRIEKIDLVDPYLKTEDYWGKQIDIIKLRQAFVQLESE
ncbi:hypothetical protein RS130_10135 [Paraglaciecola aquimarina]|uniref:Lipoprotein n=1 Tax=Paraglaciecola aquimarina TaxID=1235557 RepID=A0ABU3SW63_9ALTE|nr:hypothetical protein [Paraglaciecola aquimarina]MDU0354244.1 hypothetical protein [Paraglaciecola aquimarina]